MNEIKPVPPSNSSYVFNVENQPQPEPEPEPEQEQEQEQQPQQQSPQPLDRSSEEWPFTYFKFDGVRETVGETRGALLVVAALIAAAVFQALINPPKSFDDPGNRVTRLIFLYSSTLAYASSIVVVGYLIQDLPFQRELSIALFAMGGSVGCYISVQGLVESIFLWVCFLLPAASRVLPMWFKRIFSKLS